MLSKRNFAMMMTMITVVLALFLSSVVLKESILMIMMSITRQKKQR